MRLTPAQAATVAGVGADTVRQWRHRGFIKGGPRWIDGRSLLAHLDRRAGRPS